jgi:hypothetical protein
VQIRKVTATNFRGIREATWLLPDRRFVCLVGAGDSTKEGGLPGAFVSTTMRTVHAAILAWTASPAASGRA